MDNMKWKDVTSLHLEITASCNAACPSCARYPTGSYFVHPYISSDDSWSLEQVKKRLPPEDIARIEKIIINGTLGDFIANFHALEIVEYFRECAPKSKIRVNTNGSARTKEWWARLGSIPNVECVFAIDGLGDTHKLYRRNTNWDKIIENARAFIQAGGNAEWVMTIFKHNEHQIDECRTLSSQFGFKNFTSRFNDRPNLPVRDRNGKTVYFIESSVNTPLTMLQDVVLTEELMTRREEKLKQHIITTTQQKINKPLIGGKRDCGSYTNKNIYISAQWAVVPCCFIGNLMFNKETDRHYKDMLDLAAEYNVDVSNLVARDDRPVSAIVDLGFNWIYNSLPTSKALSICYRHCNSTTAAFTAGQLHIKRVNLQKPQ